MFASCRRWIVFYFVLAALASAVAYVRWPVIPAALAIGFGLAIPLWIAIAYVIGAITNKGGDAQLIRKAMSGERPQDGEKIAVCGTVSSGFETLEAPLSHRSAVAYEYKAIPWRRRNAGVLEGFALAPMTIDGPRGSIRVQAYPELAFPQDTLFEPQHRSNLEAYIAKTAWTLHEGIDFKRELDFMKRNLADDDGRIRFDIRRDSGNIDVASLRLEERVIAPGDHVCAIGRYSASRNALVPESETFAYQVRILKGDAQQVLRGARSGGIAHLFLGLGCLIPLLAGVLAILALVPLEAIEQMKPEKDPSWTEVRIERWIDRNVRRRYEFLKPSGDVAILLNKGQARGRLNDIHLTRASATPDGELRIASDDGSTGVLLQWRGSRIESARVLDGRSIFVAAIDVEQISQDENEMIGRITYLSNDTNLRVAFDAPKQ